MSTALRLGLLRLLDGGGVLAFLCRLAELALCYFPPLLSSLAMSASLAL